MSKKEIKPIMEEFNERIHTEGKPAVLFFYKDDCPPCDVFKPVFDKYSGGYSKKSIFSAAGLRMNLKSQRN